jgi:hypothetical protein
MLHSFKKKCLLLSSVLLFTACPLLRHFLTLALGTTVHSHLISLAVICGPVHAGSHIYGRYIVRAKRDVVCGARCVCVCVCERKTLICCIHSGLC